MKEEYKEISPELLKIAYSNAWSIENMEAHEAGDRDVTYIGSKIGRYLDNDRRNGQRITDYYRDTAGEYWFRNRALLPSAEMVSIERYIFGREITTNRKRHKNGKREETRFFKRY